MKVGDLMQRAVVTVSVDATLKEAASLLVRHRISGMPVVGPDGRVVGVLSEADILIKEEGLAIENCGFLGRVLGEAYGDLTRFEATTVAEGMTAPPLTVTSTHDVADAARLMTRHGYNRLPVVDGLRLVGIVTRADLVRAFNRDDAAVAREIASLLRETLWLSPGGIDVVVRDGAVRLTGLVDTKTLAAIVRWYVRRVPGVVRVESGLRWRVDDTRRRRRTIAGGDAMRL